MESQLREILDPDQILAVLGKVLEQRLFMVIGILNRAGMDRWQGDLQCGHGMWANMHIEQHRLPSQRLLGIGLLSYTKAVTTYDSHSQFSQW